MTKRNTKRKLKPKSRINGPQTLEHKAKSRAFLARGAYARKLHWQKYWIDLAEAIGFSIEETKKLNRKFGEHKYNSKGRGIEFLFTFEEWIAFWKASGHLYERGCRKGKYVMGRVGDTGPYSKDNVEIVLYEDNLAAQIENINRTPEYRSKMSSIMKRVRRQNKHHVQ